MKKLARPITRRISRLVKPVLQRALRYTEQNAGGGNPQMQEIERIYALKAKYITPITQPLLLISQVQRSGGTLLSQLFDNHPECYTHPAELEIGFPKKFNYPVINLKQNPEYWFKMLHEVRMESLFMEGYKKFPPVAEYDKVDIFPFYFLPHLQREIFLRVVTEQPPASQRAVLNAYFTSYFNAWLDYQGQHLSKRYIAAFTPRLAASPGNAAKFFGDYPDGRLIHVIRDPKGWYTSAHKQLPSRYPDTQSAIPIWAESAQTMVDNKHEFSDRVRIIRFDTLLDDTRGVMQKIAEWAGLMWDETLVEPTFQGQPIKANTAFSTAQYGIIDEPRRRGSQLDETDAAYIESHAGPLYQRVLDLCE